MLRNGALLVARLVAMMMVMTGESFAAPPPSSISGPLFPAVGATGADGGFRLEPRAAIDDVFGDANEFRRLIDRFLSLGVTMQRTRDDFARAIQNTLTELSSANKAAAKKGPRCPEAQVSAPYARALKLGQNYLRTGRELSRHFEQIREFDRLGETVGLTPDYRLKVRAVLNQYGALLVDYREMKVAFHDQLADELRFAGCDLDRLLARAGIEAKDDSWSSGSQLSNPAGADEVTTPPPAPVESTARSTVEPASAVANAVDRSGILFFVDNTRCPSSVHVSIDGRPLGEVPPTSRAAYQSTPGPHDICLISDVANAIAPSRKCGDPGTLRRSYLHEGWTIALRCE